jgi:hypothetical protein
MAVDWVKIRTDLYRDPKVCLIADALMDHNAPLACYVNQFYQRDMTVTRNVTRNATVGALVAVWGVMRTRGRRVGDDLLSPGASLAVLDDVSDLPGFGVAMASVGWAVESPKGLLFPRFFCEFNVEPVDEKKAKAAERQRRYRDRQVGNSDVTRDVTRDVTAASRVTSQSNARVDKSREELIQDTHTPHTYAKFDFVAADVGGIEINGELVTYSQDWIRWEAEFIRWWNCLRDATKHLSHQLDTQERRLLHARFEEPDWYWKRAGPRFPLWTSTGWRPTLMWFLEPGNANKIIAGKYTHTEEKPSDRTHRSGKSNSRSGPTHGPGQQHVPGSAGQTF